MSRDYIDTIERYHNEVACEGDDSDTLNWLREADHKYFMDAWDACPDGLMMLEIVWLAAQNVKRPVHPVNIIRCAVAIADRVADRSEEQARKASLDVVHRWLRGAAPKRDVHEACCGAGRTATDCAGVVAYNLGEGTAGAHYLLETACWAAEYGVPRSEIADIVRTCMTFPPELV
jgi:hypothetical protein